MKREAWQLRAAEQLIHTLLWVVISYAVCWAPNQFIFFAYNMGAPVDFSQVYYHISVIFAIFNSCMNPIIYSLKNKPYRLGLKEAVRWGKLSAAARSASRLAGLSKTESSGDHGHHIIHANQDKTQNTPLSSLVVLNTPVPSRSPSPSPAHSIVDEVANI